MWIKATKDRISFAKKVLANFDLKGMVVFVKPNIVSFEPYPTTTHPELLECVLSILKKWKCEIIVGDGPAPDAGDSEKIIKNHPLQAVCQKIGLTLLNIHKQPFKKIEGLSISVLPFQCDFYLSLPVLKSHPNTGLTGALKNQFGLLSNRQRLACHAGIMNIHKVIAKLNMIIKPDLTIMDFVQSYREANEARHGGIPIEPGWMLAGQDPVELDVKGFELLKKFDPKLVDLKDIAHIALLRKKN
jgi:uncharacterized protein (DUF362 family)